MERRMIALTEKRDMLGDIFVSVAGRSAQGNSN